MGSGTWLTPDSLSPQQQMQVIKQRKKTVYEQDPEQLQLPNLNLSTFKIHEG